jgi:cytochrome P450
MDTSTDAPEEQEASPLAMDDDMAANPQAMFKSLRDGSPVLALEGTGVVLSRKVDIDEALRHPEIFTSNMTAVDLKNARPLIPLQIDPPEHKKFRKLLDPIFAPRLMTAMEDEVAVLVNDLIDGFIDRGEVDFAAEFSIPYPSQVFLTLLGLPLEELDRPATSRARAMAATPQTSTNSKRRIPSTSTSTGCSTSVKSSPGTTSSPASSVPRWTGTSSLARTYWTSVSSSSSPGSTR